MDILWNILPRSKKSRLKGRLGGPQTFKSVEAPVHPLSVKKRQKESIRSADVPLPGTAEWLAPPEAGMGAPFPEKPALPYPPQGDSSDPLRRGLSWGSGGGSSRPTPLPPSAESSGSIPGAIRAYRRRERGTPLLAQKRSVRPFGRGRRDTGPQTRLRLQHINPLWFSIIYHHEGGLGYPSI